MAISERGGSEEEKLNISDKVFTVWRKHPVDQKSWKHLTLNRKQLSDSAEGGTDYTNIPSNFPRRR
mgnify:CR=1 FL=1